LIDAASNLHPINHFLETCENHVNFFYIFFTINCYDYLQKQILHNLHITNPSGIKEAFQVYINIFYKPNVFLD